EGWGGSHELKTGIYAAPRLVRETTTDYVNDGYDQLETRQIDPNNPAAGTVPWHQRFRSPSVNPSIAEHDSDIALYAQDGWMPHQRLTVNLGLRVDWVRRHDNLLDIYREKSAAVQPRAGIAYQVTKDARNVLRASYSRLYEQVNGRDYIVSFGNTGGVNTRDVYIDKAGVQQTIITPPTRSVDPSLLFDSNLHQPWADEFVVGFRKQFPGQISADVSATRRIYHDQFEMVDINGRYPSGPFQAFGGFGLVDPNQGIIYKETNGDWTRVVVSNLEGTIAKKGSVDAAVRQRRSQHARRARPRVGRGVPAVLRAARRAVQRAVGSERRRELRDPGGRLRRAARDADHGGGSALRARDGDARQWHDAAESAGGDDSLLRQHGAAVSREPDARRRPGDQRHREVPAAEDRASVPLQVAVGGAGAERLQRFQHGREHPVEHRRQPAVQPGPAAAVQPPSAAGIPDRDQLQILIAIEATLKGSPYVGVGRLF
ncbi:MAG: hypothetical protein DMF93_11605, partial [Acidobacteria bacterium]